MTAADGGGSSPDLVLRPAVSDDLDALVGVYLAAGTGEGHPPETRAPTEVRAWLGERLERRPEERPGHSGSVRHEVWVAAGEEVRGFVDLGGDWVSLLFVHPAWQSQGVGGALLGLAQALRPRGFGLRVHAANARARAFYAAHGLVELERTDGSAYDDGWPDCRLAWPGEEPLRYWRSAIDEVDAELAVLLARRFALAAAVQDHKRSTGGVGGQGDRDARREQEIVARMAALVPSLDPARLERVMHLVLEEGLAAWHDDAGV